LPIFNNFPRAMTQKNQISPPYTCKEYREEMILLALQQKLQLPDLTEEERIALLAEITRLEEKIGL
jgi:hypothetical protein